MQAGHLALPPVEVGMSEKIRNYDWGSTALGPLHRWPASLRIAVDMLLGTKFPGCLVWGPHMVTLYNDAFKPILGAKPEALGRSFNDVCAEAWDSIGAMAFRAFAGEATFVENFAMLTDRNGAMERAYFTFCYSPVRDERGVVVGFLDTVIETTANVESLQQWRTLANTFEQQVQARTLDRNRLWQLSADVMLVVQPDLLITAVNPAWSQVLGWSEAQVLNTSLMSLVHHDDAQIIEHALQRLSNGQSCENRISRLRHRDGHYRWFNWSAMPGDDGYTAVGNDITLERERDQALLQAQALLRHSHKMQAIAELSGGMAHDFNNMLAGISASLELMERRMAQGQMDKLQGYIDMARSAADRAAALTHRLLAFSRRQALDPRPVNLNELVQALEPVIQQIMGPDVALQLQVEPVPWWVLIDATQLESTLLDLCINARDAMRGAGRLRISIGNQRHTAPLEGIEYLEPGDYLSLQVEDNGHGMNAEVVARAFDPFFTTKPTGQGTGLGLSMVYGFVRQSGGQVWIESAPDAGTQVILLLPRYTDNRPQAQTQAQVEQVQAAVQVGRILLIDDDPCVRMLVREVLQEHGFEVFEAADANAGLSLFPTVGQIDLLITDIGLPGGFSGRQVGNAMRLSNPSQKVLFITAYSEQTVLDNGTLAPGTGLLTKPFSLEVLLRQVQAMLAPDWPLQPAPDGLPPA